MPEDKKNIKTGRLDPNKEQLCSNPIGCSDFVSKQMLLDLGYNQSNKLEFDNALKTFKNTTGVQDDAWRVFGHIQKNKGDVNYLNIEGIPKVDTIKDKNFQKGDVIALRNNTGSSPYQYIADSKNLYGPKAKKVNTHIGYISNIDDEGNIYVDHYLGDNNYRRDILKSKNGKYKLWKTDYKNANTGEEGYFGEYDVVGVARPNIENFKKTYADELAKKEEIKKQYNTYKLPDNINKYKSDNPKIQSAFEDFKKNYRNYGDITGLSPDKLEKLFYITLGQAEQETKSGTVLDGSENIYMTNAGIPLLKSIRVLGSNLGSSFNSAINSMSGNKPKLSAWERQILIDEDIEKGLIPKNKVEDKEYIKKYIEDRPDKFGWLDESSEDYTPSSRGWLRSKFVSPEARNLGIGEDVIVKDPTKAFINSLFVNSDNYYSLKNIYGDKYNDDELLALATNSYNSSTSKNQKYVNHFLPRKKIDYTNKVYKHIKNKYNVDMKYAKGGLIEKYQKGGDDNKKSTVNKLNTAPFKAEASTTSTAKPVVDLNFAVTPEQKKLVVKNKRQRELEDKPQSWDVKKDYVRLGINEPGLQESISPIDFIIPNPGQIKTAANLVKSSAKTLSKTIQTTKNKVDDFIYNTKYKKEIESIPSIKYKLTQEINTPEGWKRLENQGIDPKSFINQLNKTPVTTKRNQGSWDDSMSINIDFNQLADLKKQGYNISTESVLDHEIGHRMQRGFNSKAVQEYNKAVKQHNERIKILNRNSLYKRPKINEAPLYTVYSTPLDKESAELLLPVTKNIKQKDADYFFEGSEYKERLPFLRETKREMVNKGYINNIYDKITPEITKKFLNENLGNRFSKFLEINPPTTSKRLNSLLNKTPILGGTIIGAEMLTNQNKKEKPKQKLSEGGKVTKFGLSDKFNEIFKSEYSKGGYNLDKKASKLKDSFKPKFHTVDKNVTKSKSTDFEMYMRNYQNGGRLMPTSDRPIFDLKYAKGGEIDNNIDVTKAKEYAMGWYNSPMYKSILTEQYGERTAKNKTKQANYFSDYYDVNPTLKSDLEPYGKSVPKGNKRDIFLKTKFVQDNPTLVNSLFAHELFHDEMITDKDEQKIILNTPKKELNNYIANPEEVRSQIHAIRQLGQENKVYDPFTQKFEKDYLQKIDTLFNQAKDADKNYNQLQRLRKIYTDDQIIDMMNTISKTNSNDKATYVRFGGKIKKSNGGWLDKI